MIDPLRAPPLHRDAQSSDPADLPGTIALIHTVPNLIPIFDALVREHLPGWSGFNMMDESLLKGTVRDGFLSPITVRRLVSMIWSAVDAGAGAVVVTCSSLGSAVDAAGALCPVPLFRIDEGMAMAAVAAGPRIGVLATLRTTLDPTSDLIARIAARENRTRSITAELAEGAFEKLVAGDAQAHDRAVAESLRSLAPRVDVIVLAQASMARVVAGMDGDLGAVPVLTSPDLGMAHVARCLTG